jgi:hypothetical protein
VQLRFWDRKRRVAHPEGFYHSPPRRSDFVCFEHPMETTRDTVCRNCVTPVAYAQSPHMPVTGSTMKQVGHTFGGSSSLACALLTLVCG